MRKITLSVVLTTFNEEKMLGDCLQSIKDIATEIIVVDGTSSDTTVAIAKSFGAKVIVTTNKPNFHINKQMAIEAATCDWVLLLDADERVSKALAKEIEQVMNMTHEEMDTYQSHLPSKKLFDRHVSLLEKRDGPIGEKTGEYVAFFFPRKNYFLGHYMRYGGVYPDGVIRLFKNKKAYLPAKDVHEQMAVKGRVGWLQHDLLHMDSPTFEKYITRWKRYTHFIAMQYKDQKLGKDPLTMFTYLVWMPIQWFVMAYGRHKGFLDGWSGFVFAFFSSLRFPVAYMKYRKLSV